MNIEGVDYFLTILEFLGTFAFAISGIRHAAAHQLLLNAKNMTIGGGTVRDILLGVTPFWMTRPIYILCTILAQAFLIIFQRYIKRLDNAWFVFDTLGLALFTIAGMQKTLDMGHPFWIAIIMGTITGSAGGVIRDILLNNVPVIFQKEIYAMASIAGGMLYWLMLSLRIDAAIAATVTFLVIVAIRFLAVRYHISLPHFNPQEDD